MKILYDDIIFELQKAGGISKYWGKLIENISSKNNISIVEIQGKNSKNNVFYPNISNLIKLELFPLIIRRYFGIINTYNCDILHSSYYRVPFIKNKKIKQVVTVHDFMYEFFDSGLKKNIHIWQKKKAMFNADAIICVSNHTKKDLIKLYPRINKDILYVVPNGVDKDFKIINTEKKNFLLYVGNRVGCKNFEFILKLMVYSEFIQKKEFSLMCVGGGNFGKNEVKLFEKYNLKDKVKQVLFIENNELNILYNEAYALLFPSKYEGFGIPALEAQMAGCPVLYAKTSSLPEVMGYEDLGYTLDMKEEADIKLQQLEDNSFRKKIISEGVSHATKLTWENSASLTYEVYREVLKNV